MIETRAAYYVHADTALCRQTRYCALEVGIMSAVTAATDTAPPPHTAAAIDTCFLKII